MSHKPTEQVSLTRREFLRRTAILAGAAVLPTPTLAQPSEPLPIIDTHVHFYDPTRPGGAPWPTPDLGILYSPHLPGTFQSLTGKLGVAGVVVIEANALPGDNQWVLDLAKDHPIIVGYIGRLQPGSPEFAKHFGNYVKNPIFRGLRLRPEMLRNAGEADFEKDVQRLAEHKLTVDLAGDATVVDAAIRLTRIAPGLRLVIDHLPFREWGQDTALMRKTLAPLAPLSNMYGKISDVPRRVGGKLREDAAFYRPTLDVLREIFGDDRILFGSNWPVSDLVAPYASVQRIAMDYFENRDHTAAEKFFWRNSSAAYRWLRRGAAAKLG